MTFNIIVKQFCWKFHWNSSIRSEDMNIFFDHINYFHHFLILRHFLVTSNLMMSAKLILLPPRKRPSKSPVIRVNEHGFVHLETKYGFNIIFFCYVPNRQIIDKLHPSSVESFSSITLNLTQALLTKMPLSKSYLGLRFKVYIMSFTGHIKI